MFQVEDSSHYSIMNTGESKKCGSVESLFVLCETCHWCAAYFNKSRVPNNKCLIYENNVISTFPYYQKFTFNYNEKRGVELEFGLKKSKNEDKGR
jgi:hypothetical protein